jgi:hypothetical protein
MIGLSPPLLVFLSSARKPNQRETLRSLCACILHARRRLQLRRTYLVFAHASVWIDRQAFAHTRTELKFGGPRASREE